MRVRRVAVTGSRGWQRKWAYYLWDDLEDQLARLPPDGVLVVSHGACEEGVDLYAHEWVMLKQAQHRPGQPRVIEDTHPADWNTCNGPKCTPSHRRVRRDGSTYCPSAGLLRNPDVIAGADVVLALCLDKSKGTCDAIDAALDAGCNTVVRYQFTSKPSPARPRRPDTNLYDQQPSLWP